MASNNNLSIIEKNPFKVLSGVKTIEQANQFVADFQFDQLSKDEALAFANIFAIASVNKVKNDNLKLEINLGSRVSCQIYDEVIGKLAAVNDKVLGLDSVKNGTIEAALARVKHNLPALESGDKTNYIKGAKHRNDLSTACDYLEVFADKLTKGDAIKTEELNKAVEVFKSIASHKSGAATEAGREAEPFRVDNTIISQNRTQHRTYTLMALEIMEPVMEAYKAGARGTAVQDVDYGANRASTRNATEMWDQLSGIKQAIDNFHKEFQKLQPEQKDAVLLGSVKKAAEIADKPLKDSYRLVNGGVEIIPDPHILEGLAKFEDAAKGKSLVKS